MGRPSKLSEAQWNEEFAFKAASSNNSEKSVMLMLELFLRMGDLERAINVPKITGYRFEFPVASGRIDLLLFHADKSMTIIEAKAEYSFPAIVAGIGQLCMYAVKLPAKLHKDQQPTFIRRLLCAHCPAEEASDLVHACKLAGCRFAYLPSYAEFKEQASHLLQEA